MLKPYTFHIARNSIMKALIVYDNFVFAAKANAMLQRVSHRADSAMCWDIRPWRADELKLPHNAELALAEAMDAHLIVFAGEHIQTIPSWMLRWLERWAANRQIKDAALAAIGTQGDYTLSRPAIPELSRFAKQHGLSFIFDEGLSGHNGADFLANRIPEPNEASDWSYPSIWDSLSSAQNSHWGINE
jgi:hypothetical protein